MVVGAGHRANPLRGVTHGESAEVLSGLGDLVRVEADDDAAWNGRGGHKQIVSPHTQLCTGPETFSGHTWLREASRGKCDAIMQ